MARKKLSDSQKLLKKKMQEIKKYVDFDYSRDETITGGKAQKIHRYHRAIRELTHGRVEGFHFYRPRKKQNLLPAQKAAQHQEHLPGLKGAFFRTAGPDSKPRIRVNKKGRVTVSEKHVVSHFVEFNKNKLVADPEKHAADLIDENPSPLYIIAAGKHEIRGARPKKSTLAEIGKLATKYGDDTKNNFFGNWMLGLKTLEFHEQDDIESFMLARSQARSTRKRRAAAKRAKIAKKKKVAKKTKKR